MTIKNTFFILMFLCMTVRSFAQDNVIEFDSKNCGMTEHPVSGVEVIDSRAYPDAVLGVIGIKRDPVPLITRAPLKKSMEHFYLNCLSSAKKNTDRKLIVVLHTFYACQQMKNPYAEKTHFSYAADYFLSEAGDKYTLLGAVDTIIYTKKRALLSDIDASLCSLYEDLYQHPKQDSKLYSYNELVNYEQEQKKKFPAYKATTNDSNAVYTTWNDFLSLNKKEGYSIELKKKYYSIAHTSKRGQVWHEPVYLAAVFAYGSKLYYTIEGVPYELYKKGADFFVTGATSRFITTPSGPLEGGAPGGFVSFSAVIYISGKPITSETYEFKINYHNGKLIPVKKMDTPHK